MLVKPKGSQEPGNGEKLVSVYLNQMTIHFIIFTVFLHKTSGVLMTPAYLMQTIWFFFDRRELNEVKTRFCEKEINNANRFDVIIRTTRLSSYYLN